MPHYGEACQMNIYQKLQKARVELSKLSLKKSGKNTFANYTYFELSDFLPQTQTIFNEVGLTGIVTFDDAQATLSIYEHEGDGFIVITCPRKEAALKGCHPIQNEGAIQTYQRRYLWVSAMEISEHDAIDMGEKKKEKEIKALTPHMEKILEYCCELIDKDDPAFCNEWRELDKMQQEIIWKALNTKQKTVSRKLLFEESKNVRDSNAE